MECLIRLCQIDTVGLRPDFWKSDLEDSTTNEDCPKLIEELHRQNKTPTRVRCGRQSFSKDIPPKVSNQILPKGQVESLICQTL